MEQMQRWMMAQTQQIEMLQRQIQQLTTAQSTVTTNPTFAASTVKLDLPPKFAGQPSELATWLFTIEQYASIVGMTSQVDIVKLAVSRLEKDALIWWRQLSARGSDYQLGVLEWVDFKVYVNSAFADVDRELKLRRRLSTLKQTTSVTAYTRVFRQTVLELADQAPDDGALMFMYTEGLKPEVQLQVLLARPVTLQAAEQVAERTDVAFIAAHRQAKPQQQQRPKEQPGWYQRTQQPQYQFSRPPPPPPRQGPVPMDLGSMQQQPPPQRPPVTCYRCGRLGHYARNCRMSPSLHHVDGQPLARDGVAPPTPAPSGPPPVPPSAPSLNEGGDRC